MSRHKKQGVTGSRVYLLHESWVQGTLDPAIAGILDSLEPGWRDDPETVRWTAAYTDYRNWVDTHGRAPAVDDDGAAGLLPWLHAQARADLTAAQLRAVQALPGWIGNMDDPASHHFYALLARLHAAGVRPSRTDDRRLIDQVVASFTARHPNADDIGVLWLDFTGAWEQSQYMTYLLFYARNLRQPAASEPSGRWIRAKRAAASLPEPLAQALELIPDWRGAEAIPPAFTSGLAKCTAWMDAEGRKPRRRGRTRDERRHARWLDRWAARARSGELPPTAAGALSELLD